MANGSESNCSTGTEKVFDVCRALERRRMPKQTVEGKAADATADADAGQGYQGRGITA